MVCEAVDAGDHLACVDGRRTTTSKTQRRRALAQPLRRTEVTGPPLSS